MRQKYVLTKSGKEETLTISEYAEIEKDVFSLICQESHGGEVIRAGMASGPDKLISTFRTHNMYPRFAYAEKMAEAIVRLYDTAKEGTAELMFDDQDALIHAAAGAAFTGGHDAARVRPEAVDELIDDEMEVDLDMDDGLALEDDGGIEEGDE